MRLARGRSHTIRLCPRSSGNYQVRRLLQGDYHSLNACLSTLRCRPRRGKFSTTLPGTRIHRTRSTASFTGGYSMLTFGTGRRKLRRRSYNSSNKVSSKKSHLRTAKYFTTSHRNISPRFNSALPKTPKSGANDRRCGTGSRPWERGCRADWA